MRVYSPINQGLSWFWEYFETVIKYQPHDVNLIILKEILCLKDGISYVNCLAFIFLVNEIDLCFTSHDIRTDFEFIVKTELVVDQRESLLM